MTTLTFTLIAPPAQRVDMSPLVCQNLEGLDLDTIAALELQCGKRKLRVDQLFYINGSNTQDILIADSTDKPISSVELNGGSISVQGNAGAYLACR